MTRSGGLYRAFGLDFQSALALPEMRIGRGTANVEVALASAACPPGLTGIERGVAAGADDFWMDVPGIVRLHVSGGARMKVEMVPGASEGEVRAYLLGSGIGALLHQRGLLPLHASAVEIDGRAVLFTGASGAGKSTLALHLVQRGHRLISDDISAIDVSSGRPQLWPGLINVKLWREALGSVGRAPDGLEPVLAAIDKYRLPLPQSEDRPFEIAAVYVLDTDDDDVARIDTLGGAAAATALFANTFRGQLVEPMGIAARHFDQCVAVARATRIAALSRPWSLDAMSHVCDAVAIDTAALG